MDVYIATKNIDNFNTLLLLEKDGRQRQILLSLLLIEKEKLAVALAAQRVNGQHH